MSDYGCTPFFGWRFPAPNLNLNPNPNLNPNEHLDPPCATYEKNSPLSDGPMLRVIRRRGRRGREHDELHPGNGRPT